MEGSLVATESLFKRGLGPHMTGHGGPRTKGGMAGNVPRSTEASELKFRLRVKEQGLVKAGISGAPQRTPAHPG